MKKINVVGIVGPTASGKTELSVRLAKYFDSEIVSADSMQIYKGMNIATAKPTPLEQQGIKHHLIDFVDTQKSFSVAQYCSLAHEVIKDIAFRNKLPIVVGGTGLYVDSLLNNITFTDIEADEKLRADLYKLYEDKGMDYLLDKIKEFDPASYLRLSEQKNIKRIIRCIEVYKTTGKTQTQLNEESHKFESPYNTVKIGLKAKDREFLYNKINRRVDMMLDMGLLDEARKFLSAKTSSTAVQAIGYKELALYFDGVMPLEECIGKIKMNTRRYAKRQMTWFMRDESVIWMNIDEISKDEIYNQCVALIKRNFYNG